MATMKNDTIIRPVSNWASIAAQCRRAGFASVADVILYFALRGIHIPARAMAEVYDGWQREGRAQ